MADNLVDTVTFRAVAPYRAADLKGLDMAEAKLRAIGAAADALHGKFNQLNSGTQFKRSRAELEQTLKATGLKNLGVKDVAATLGVPDLKDFQAFIQRWKAMHGDWRKFMNAGGQFASAPKAAQVAQAYFRSVARNMRDPLLTLRQMFGAKPEAKAAAVKPTETAEQFLGPRLEQLARKRAEGGRFNIQQNKLLKKIRENDPALFAAFEAKVAALKAPAAPVVPAGTVKLIVPPAQIQAVLGPGKVALTVPAAQVAGVAKGGGGAGGGGGKGGGGGSASGAGGGGGRNPAAKQLRDTLAAINRELQETIRGQVTDPKTGKLVWKKLAGVSPGTEAAARDKAAAQIRAAVGNLTGKQADDALARAAQLETQAENGRQREMMSQLRKVGKLRKDLAKARDQADDQQAQQLAAELRAEQARLRALNRFLKTGQQAQAQIQQTRQKTATANAQQATKQMLAQQAAQLNNLTMAEGQRRLADFLARGGTIVNDTRTTKSSKGGLQQFGSVTAQLESGGRVETMKVGFNGLNATLSETTRALKATRAEAGFLAGDFVRNTVKVAAWTASVGLLYGTLNLAATSMRSLIEAGAQTARLDQVFRGVGGTTQELARDVMHLAAVNGRATDEAMQSAIQWSRHGHTRAQVNEAVRVSLIAANVAELSAAEATEKLQGVMQNYGLRVGQLRTVLGQLNTISNTYNVTNADMLEGISRTAAVAKQAGLPLSELMGILGATVGATAQTGANIGNAVKSITVGLSNPVLQKKLREQFGFEATTGGEDIKGMSQLLADLFVRYQHLNDMQRQSLLFSVAGKTQASRLQAILDSYVKAQVLAINAQLNLNSAEEENAKIKATLKSQLQGLTTEWERFVNIQGTRGPVQALGQIGTALRNVLTVMNAPGMNLLTTLLLGVGVAGAGKLALTALRGSGAKGFIGRSAAHLSATAAELSGLAVAALPAGAMRRRDFIGATLRRRDGLGTLARVGTVGALAVKQFAGPLAIATAAVMVFNNVMDQMGLSSERAEARLAGFNDEAERARSAASAYAEAGKLFITLQRTLAGEKGFQGTRPEDRNRLIEQTSKVAFMDEKSSLKREQRQAALAKELRMLDEESRRTGDRSKFEARLNEERERNLGLRRQALQDEFEANRRFRRENESEIASLRGKNRGMLRYFGGESRERRAMELERRNSELDNSQTRLVLEQTQVEEDAYKLTLQHDQKHLENLERIKLAHQSIAEFYRSFKPNNALEERGFELATMEAEQRAAEATLRRLDEEDARDLVGQKQREEALRELAAREKEVREAMARLNEQGRGLTGQSSPGRVALLNTLTFGLVDSPVEAANRDLNRRFGRARGELERIEAEKQRVEAGRLPAGELGFVSREQRRRQTQEEMTERQARIDAFKRSERDALTLTRAQLAREEGGRDVRRRDFGRNETERLLNQQQFVTDEIARLSAKPTRTMEEQVRLVEMLGDAYRVVNALRDREADVERELGQLQSDRLRELRDSILGSGPAELLRKLAAMRTTFDQRGNMTPLTPAQYLSFSPGFRGDINQINPQFDPRKMELDEERNRLAGLATSFDDFLKQVTQISRQRIFELADPQLPAAFAAGLDAMTKSASFAAMTLDKLAESVAKLDNRLNGQAPATDGLQTGGGGQLSGKGGAAGYTRNFSGNQ